MGRTEGGNTLRGVRKGVEAVFLVSTMNGGGNTLDIRHLGVLASSKDRKFHPPKMLMLLTLW